MRYPLSTSDRRTFPSARGRRGFTLIEAAIVTVIIGVGVVSMLQLLAAGTVSNSEGTELTTAINLANNVREFSLGLAYYDPDTDMTVNPPKYEWNTKEANVKAYDNIMDLDGPTDTGNQADDPASGYQKFSPPLDVRRDTINTYSGWEQWVKVETVSPNAVTSVLPHDAASATARVTVKIVRNGSEVYRMSWLAVAPK
jgi:prepilin-type N-terminal cleavage/methylation domain-containing protein